MQLCHVFGSAAEVRDQLWQEELLVSNLLPGWWPCHLELAWNDMQSAVLSRFDLLWLVLPSQSQQLQIEHLRTSLAEAKLSRDAWQVLGDTIGLEAQTFVSGRR